MCQQNQNEWSVCLSICDELLSQKIFLSFEILKSGAKPITFLVELDNIFKLINILFSFLILGTLQSNIKGLSFLINITNT